MSVFRLRPCWVAWSMLKHSAQWTTECHHTYRILASYPFQGDVPCGPHGCLCPDALESLLLRITMLTAVDWFAKLPELFFPASYSWSEPSCWSPLSLSGYVLILSRCASCSCWVTALANLGVFAEMAVNKRWSVVSAVACVTSWTSDCNNWVVYTCGRRGLRYRAYDVAGGSRHEINLRAVHTRHHSHSRYCSMNQDNVMLTVSLH